MSTGIVRHQNYVAGWLDSSIDEFLNLLSPKWQGTKYALITCLDSNADPASLRSKSRELRSLASKMQVVGRGLLAPTEVLLQVESHSRIFFGFDEVWFFPTNKITPKPNSGSLVGPARIDKVTLSGLAEWMKQNKCSLALGDGEGLNFIIKARGLVAHLVSQSLEQPKPQSAFVT